MINTLICINKLLYLLVKTRVGKNHDFFKKIKKIKITLIFLIE